MRIVQCIATFEQEAHGRKEMGSDASKGQAETLDSHSSVSATDEPRKVLPSRAPQRCVVLVG